MKDLEALPDPEWLIEGIILTKSLAVLYGAPASGKSFLALGIANHVVEGQEWLSRFAKKGDAVYLNAEGGTAIKFRQRASHQRFGPTNRSPFFLNGSLNLAEKNEVKLLVESIRAQGCQPVFFVIDTLARYFGPGDENVSKDMNAFIEGVDRLKAEFGAAVLIVHHTGKKAKSGEGQLSASRSSRHRIGT